MVTFNQISIAKKRYESWFGKNIYEFKITYGKLVI